MLPVNTTLLNVRQHNTPRKENLHGAHVPKMWTKIVQCVQARGSGQGVAIQSCCHLLSAKCRKERVLKGGASDQPN